MGDARGRLPEGCCLSEEKPRVPRSRCLLPLTIDPRVEWVSACRGSGLGFPPYWSASRGSPSDSSVGPSFDCGPEGSLPGSSPVGHQLGVRTLNASPQSGLPKESFLCTDSGLFALAEGPPSSSAVVWSTQVLVELWALERVHRLAWPSVVRHLGWWAVFLLARLPGESCGWETTPCPRSGINRPAARRRPSEEVRCGFRTWRPSCRLGTPEGAPDRQFRHRGSRPDSVPTAESCDPSAGSHLVSRLPGKSWVGVGPLKPFASGLEPWSWPCSDSRRNRLKVWPGGSFRRGSGFQWALAARFRGLPVSFISVVFPKKLSHDGGSWLASPTRFGLPGTYLSARLECRCPMDTVTPPRLNPEGMRLGYPPSTPLEEVFSPPRSKLTPKGSPRTSGHLRRRSEERRQGCAVRV